AGTATALVNPASGPTGGVLHTVTAPVAGTASRVVTVPTNPAQYPVGPPPGAARTANSPTVVPSSATGPTVITRYAGPTSPPGTHPLRSVARGHACREPSPTGSGGTP